MQSSTQAHSPQTDADTAEHPFFAERPLSAERQLSAERPLSALQTQRNQLLERLMPLAQQRVTADPKRDAEQVAVPLQRFCRELVNYLAAGHYYILQYAKGGWSQRAAIAQTTERAMRFAEQHENQAESSLTPSWRITRSQLGNLALLLTERFDSEDRLLGGHQATHN